ncbi:Protein of unknown function [Anaerobranca californiensis DSM 14826]|jgi:hypothetical protein|uniref:DUF1657 domain-containing protein n=1 Tax=Anaerobranca californiensis DSM 14826 TaxID=1120989 RepID=A0A1M6LGJ2_9FIRM|nr:DUF1657 domain-containing protein [Anaerobranca californiensis]SHJ70205.1 Protein of unknown function [Anaerobranca californiensis DSM 14826]
MTVANKLAQTLSSCEAVAANLKAFALDTQDQQAKQMYQQCSQSMEQIVKQLRQRLDYAMEEEGQYQQEVGGLYPQQNITNQQSGDNQ